MPSQQKRTWQKLKMYRQCSRLTRVLWWTDTIAVAFFVHRAGHSGRSQPPVRAESVDGDGRVRAIQRPLTGIAVTGRRASFSCTARGGIWGRLWNARLNSMITYSLCYLCIKKFLSYSTDCSCSSQAGRQRRPPAGQWPATETDSGQSVWQWPTSVWQFLRNHYRSIALLICRLTGKGEMELLETPTVSFFLRYKLRFEYGSANTTHPLFPWCLSLQWAAVLGECRCACGGSAVVCSWYLKVLCSYWRRT